MSNAKTMRPSKPPSPASAFHASSVQTTKARLLARDESTKQDLLMAIEGLMRTSRLSSAHVNFHAASDDDAFVLRRARDDRGWSLREDIQYHWHNDAGWTDFEGFLAAMDHKHRKNIRQERRKVREAGITFRVVHGGEASEDDLFGLFVLDLTHVIPAGSIEPGIDITISIDGMPVGTLYSGPGGEMTATFPIPVLLKGLERIAIRTQGNPFFSYNWFDNQTEPLPTPTFVVCGVLRDDIVVIRTDPTFLPNRNFTVMMNYMGTLGTDGYVVGGFNTGPTGVTTATYAIPDGLRGLDQIQIRAEEVGGPFYSYNYFDNQTAIYCAP